MATPAVVQPVQRLAAMPLREFEDADEVSWHVWDTVPGTTSGLTDEYRSGWLTFDDGHERRRLAPIPDGWERLTAERLALLLRVAQERNPRDGALRPVEDERRLQERRQAERRIRDRRRGRAHGSGRNNPSA